MTLDFLYRREEIIGDKLSKLELLHEWTNEQRERYEDLEAQFQDNQRQIRAMKG